MQPDDAAPVPAKLVAYVSGYGPDITWHAVNAGALVPVSKVAAFAPSPSFAAIDPAVSTLYAVSEANDRVGAYAIDPATGALTFINDVASGGSGPAHVSVDRAGKFGFVANYGDGSIAVLPIGAGGRLAAPQQTLSAGANAHMIITDPSNHFVFVPCLGSDYVAQYLFDPSSGALTPNAVPHLATASGAGPRHLAFAPDAKHAYLINEKASTLSALAFDAATGRLSEIQTVSTLPAGVTVANTGAEVTVAPSGRFVYASNRGDDSIAEFSIDPATGRLALVAHAKTLGQTPRNFTIDPMGAFLYAANQASNTVVPFAIDAATGKLTPTGAPITQMAPTFVAIAGLPGAP